MMKIKNPRLISNIMMTINYGWLTFYSIKLQSPFLAVTTLTLLSSIWFHSIGKLKGLDIADKHINKILNTFGRLYERYKKGDIREINEQVIEEEMALNKFYK